MIQRLALQSYHLPGNSWCQDWCQFMMNNHPILGICCHHSLHPIGAFTRVVALCGTFLFGLVVTNCFYLFYLWNPRFNQPFVTFDDYNITTGLLLLWTVGGSLHTMYNLLMWHIAACACCRTGGFCESIACCPSFGKHLLRYFVLIVLMFGVTIVLMRVAVTNAEEVATDDDETGGSFNIMPEDDVRLRVDSAQEFQFVLGFVVEMALSLILYYPIGVTVLFSGILGCGRIPILGGRPAQVEAEERRCQQQGVNDIENDSSPAARRRKQNELRNELRALRMKEQRGGRSNTTRSTSTDTSL